MATRVSADQRRRDLVAAAFRVMARDGITATTTRAICSEAGVPQSVFHYCFRSKSELLQELMRTMVADMVDAALLASAATSDPRESIRAGFRILWEEAVAHPDRQLVSYELTTTTLRDPELLELPGWQYQQYFAAGARFADAVAQTADIEWTAPIPVLSRMFATTIDGLVLGWLADRDDAQAEESLMLFADLFAGLARPRSQS
jgi:AcrR family transcriptional regulator